MSIVKLSREERRKIENLLRDRKDAAIKAATANDPTWKDRVEERKTKAAIGLLKVEKELVERDALKKKIAVLESQLSDVNARITAKLPMNERVTRGYGSTSCPTKMDFCTAMSVMVERVHAKQMMCDTTGNKVHNIENTYQESLVKLEGCLTREDVAASEIL